MIASLLSLLFEVPIIATIEHFKEFFGEMARIVSDLPWVLTTTADCSTIIRVSSSEPFFSFKFSQLI